MKSDLRMMESRERCKGLPKKTNILLKKSEVHKKILDFLPIKFQSLMDKSMNTKIDLSFQMKKRKHTEKKFKN